MHYIRREFPQQSKDNWGESPSSSAQVHQHSLTHSLDCVYNLWQRGISNDSKTGNQGISLPLVWPDLIWFFCWMDDLTRDQPQLHYYQSIAMHFKEFIKGRSSIGFLVILPQMFPLMFYPQIGQAFYTISGCDEPLTQCCVHLPFRSPVITDINSGC